MPEEKAIAITAYRVESLSTAAQHAVEKENILAFHHFLFGFIKKVINFFGNFEFFVEVSDFN